MAKKIVVWSIVALLLVVGLGYGLTTSSVAATRPILTPEMRVCVDAAIDNLKFKIDGNFTAFRGTVISNNDNFASQLKNANTPPLWDFFGKNWRTGNEIALANMANGQKEAVRGFKVALRQCGAGTFAPNFGGGGWE